MGTPLARYVDWYEALTPDLRTHLAPHLFRPGLPGLDHEAPPAPFEGARLNRARTTTIGSRLARVATNPVREAELAVRLAVRTDEVLGDVTIREQWTGEGALVALGSQTHDEARRAIHERVVARSMEWMRAAEQWAALRESALAGRRIERWLQKRGDLSA